MSEHSTDPGPERGVGPAPRPPSQRIVASGLSDKPVWPSLGLKPASIWGMSTKDAAEPRGSLP
jgi:hypothetical protein